MKQLFDQISQTCSKVITRTYSTSFSLGIYCLNRRLHHPVYSIYGFVRCADEIVDSFHDYDKASLLAEFRADTLKAIQRKISLNPVLNSFQQVVHQYGIEQELIDCFLDSMAMDLGRQTHSSCSYEQYILGSAEVVGLMCLRVFTEGNEALYQQLKPAAMHLGAAFQKVNFLRDAQHDYEELGRVYFPSVNLSRFGEEDKQKIEKDIQADFEQAIAGIRQLPVSSRFGVYVAYVYYRALFNKIRALPSHHMVQSRVRISNYRKMGLLAGSYVKHSFRML